MSGNTRRPEPRRLALAVHEAAHAVIGVVHGARIQKVGLNTDGAGRISGHTDFDPVSFAAGAPSVYRSHIAAAGAVAEAMLACGPRPTLRQVESRLCGTDRAELVHEAMATLRPVPVPVAEVTSLLARCWSAVSDLAADLYIGRTVSHAEVCAALGLSDEGGPYSVGLAVIRS